MPSAQHPKARIRPTPTSAPVRSSPLAGLTIAVLATDGVEQSELLLPHQALIRAGAIAHIIAPASGSLTTWHEQTWSRTVRIDRTITQARHEVYDALVLPGGTLNADALRMDRAAIAFVAHAVAAGIPIAAICHGPWLLIEAGGAEGHRLTSWPSLRTDLINAGATWVNQPVVTDRHLITSRKPADIPAFNRAIIDMLSTQRSSVPVTAADVTPVRG